ncbi:Protein tramtrack alpha isoform [Bienertia sinuspersici]
MRIHSTTLRNRSRFKFHIYIYHDGQDLGVI